MHKKLLDFFLPNPSMCVLCHAPMDTLGLCEACLDRWDDFSKKEGQCKHCGSFGVRAPVCDVCRDWPKYFLGNRALLPYTDEVRDALVALKFHAEPWRAAGFRALFERLEPPAVDYIMPVPLHKARARERGYNQSLLLAKVAGEVWGIDVKDGVLLRHKNTKHQIGLPKTQRAANVEGAFGVHPKRTAFVEGQRIMLIDDVLTTGATLLSCARTLHQTGAESICALTLTSAIQ